MWICSYIQSEPALVGPPSRHQGQARLLQHQNTYKKPYACYRKA